MMNLRVAILGCAVVFAAYGQGRVSAGGGSRGGFGGGGFGGGPARGISAAPVRPFPGAGLGSVVNPSGVPQMFGVVNPIYSPNLSFGQRLSATVSGSDWSVGAYQRQRWRGGIVPYPVFIGGFTSTYQAPVPNVTVINAPAPSPSVIINQGYTPDRMNPTVTEVGPGTPEGMTTYQAPVVQNPEGRPLREAIRGPVNPEGRPTVYLVAMKSGEVYSALAFWLEEGTFHYITTKHAHNRASYDLVDIDLSRQLNEERGLEFRLNN